MMPARRIRMLIGGEWADGRGGEALPLTSPATGQEIALVEQGTRTDVEDAVKRAWQAQAVLARMNPFERAALCHAVADRLLARREQIARDITLEQGKPYATQALAEVEVAAGMFGDAAECAKRLAGEVLPSAETSKRVLTLRQARGVYGIITPWNFPLAIPSEYLSAGLATGNAMVWKPSEWTPLAATHLAGAFLDAGVPEGTVNLVLGAPDQVGDEVAANPGIVAIGLTGSSRTGELVARRAAGKPLLLELGGNGPTIVFADADLEGAVARTAAGCFDNAGQVCNATERILVQRDAHDDLVAGLVEAAQVQRLGLPFDPDTTLGPLTNEPTAAKVDAHLADAARRGAEVLTGGDRAEGQPTPLYYQATVIDAVSPDMRLNLEETFGPVAPVLTFASEEEALELAASCPLGLNAGLFTGDLGRALRVAERLRCGTVHVNETSCYWQPHTPAGGFTGTRSGMGRIGGMYTLLEMTQLKTITFDLKPLRR
jgi:acyl-CoA reductase-like NAD-dependent aldehyde dehydrogenase